MSILLSPIVGAHFRPPAKLVLSVLAVGTELVLDPEPGNQYDEHALGVWLPRASLLGLSEQAVARLEAELVGFGWDLGGLLTLDRLQLGYCASGGNSKALAVNSSYRPNRVLLDAMAGSPGHQASLAFGPGGEAVVKLELPDVAGLPRES